MKISVEEQTIDVGGQTHALKKNSRYFSRSVHAGPTG